MDKRAHYITTTLPYVNDNPHLGHALEFVQADALARFWRAQGREVFFNTGTDEHGQKIAQKAAEAQQPVQEYVDHYAQRFMHLKDTFSLSYDRFIRTTEEAHMQAAQELWRRCDAAGAIYQKEYTGLYCVGCELFLKESDLDEDGNCPNHPDQTPQEISETNYFFRLTAYTEQLREQLATHGRIVPEWRREEALRFLDELDEDISISRSAARMSWGVPVPDDDTQVMYVWFDALTNYISTLGWPDDADGYFQRFWADGATLQVAGKDQVRFQSIIWQAMLLSAGLPTTDTVFYHGFITSGGKKMSKSIGNVISPFELVERYGTDATRYLLLAHVHPIDDTDITWERLDEWYTADLVNGIGNLTARIMKLAETHLDEAVTPAHEDAPADYTAALEGYAFNDALDVVWQRSAALDEKITETEPFKLIKTDVEAAQKIIQELTLELYTIGRLLSPFMPEASAAVQQAVRTNTKPDNLFPRL